MNNTIYVFGVYTGHCSYGYIRDADPDGDVRGFAVDGFVIDDEDGVEKMHSIASHWSSGPGWCMHDMGITSDWQHDEYEKAHPNGYSLEWLGVFRDTQEVFEIIKGKIKER